MKTLTALIFAGALALSAQQPTSLTPAEKAEITELVLEQSEAARAEFEVREQLQQLAQQKMQEARQRHQAAAAKLDARLKELAAARKVDPAEFQLNRKTGAWVKREKIADTPATKK